MISYPITPVPAPRMTQSDRWKERPCVLRYFAFRDECRLRRVNVQNGDWITFVLPMPKSWSEKKKAFHDGQPHTQKPDKDNLEKGLLDACFDDDCGIHDTRTSKIWGRRGEIRVSPMPDIGIASYPRHVTGINYHIFAVSEEDEATQIAALVEE